MANKNFICRLKRFDPSISDYVQISAAEIADAIQINGEIKIVSDEEQPVIAQNLGESCVMLDPEPE